MTITINTGETEDIYNCVSILFNGKDLILNTGSEEVVISKFATYLINGVQFDVAK